MATRNSNCHRHRGAAGNRRVAGASDLLLELPDGGVLIDQKSYPGGRDTWQAKAAEFAPQFAAYGEAPRLAGKRVLEQWVSFAIAGGAVRLMETDVKQSRFGAVVKGIS